MDSVPATIKSSKVFFESDTAADGVASQGRYGTSGTSNQRSLGDAYGQLKQLLADVSEDLGSSLAHASKNGPSHVEVEFALTFAAEANVWVVKTTGEGSVKATLTWDLATPS